MMHKAFHDIDMWQEKEEEGLTKIRDRVDAAILRFKVYIKKNKERLIIASNNSRNNLRTNEKIKNLIKQKQDA